MFRKIGLAGRVETAYFTCFEFQTPLLSTSPNRKANSENDRNPYADDFSNRIVIFFRWFSFVPTLTIIRISTGDIIDILKVSRVYRQCIEVYQKIRKQKQKRIFEDCRSGLGMDQKIVSNDSDHLGSRTSYEEMIFFQRALCTQY